MPCTHNILAAESVCWVDLLKSSNKFLSRAKIAREHGVGGDCGNGSFWLLYFCVCVRAFFLAWLPTKIWSYHYRLSYALITILIFSFLCFMCKCVCVWVIPFSFYFIFYWEHTHTRTCKIDAIQFSALITFFF